MAQQFRLPTTLTRLVALVPTAGVLYLVEDTLGSAAVHRLDLASGAVRRAGGLDDFGGGALSVGPGGATFAYTRARETANDLAWMRL